MAKQVEEVSRQIKNGRGFTYVKGDVKLAFDINVDDPRQARSFLQCLIAAQKDIEDTIKELEEN